MVVAAVTPNIINRSDDWRTTGMCGRCPVWASMANSKVPAPRAASPNSWSMRAPVNARPSPFMLVCLTKKQKATYKESATVAAPSITIMYVKESVICLSDPLFYQPAVLMSRQVCLSAGSNQGISMPQRPRPVPSYRDC